MHKHHDIFVSAIHDRKKLILRFFSKEDGRQLVRTCAPFDYAPSRRAADKTPRYHFWDYDSDEARHTLSLLPEQIVSINATDEAFDPADIITWDVAKSPWTLQRDWGKYS